VFRIRRRGGVQNSENGIRDTEDEMRKYNQRPNIEMEPRLQTVSALMLPRRAAHFAR